MITHIVFDFDGTLIDSMQIHTDKTAHLLRTQGIEMPEGLINLLTPLGDKGAAVYLRDRFHLTISFSEMERIINDFALERYQNTIPSKPHALDFVRRLHAQGYPLYILSASPHRLIDPCAERLGFTPLFRDIFSCEDFGKVKTDPTLFTDLAARLGTTPEHIAFFDDNRIAIETATACGFYTVGVADPSSAKDEAVIRTTANAFLDTFRDAALGVLDPLGGDR